MELEITPEGRLHQKRAKSPLISYKYFTVDVKSVDENSRRVTGYFAAFGNKDLVGDIILKGAFAKSIQDRGPGKPNQIAFCWQHDLKQPIGRIDVLKEDDYGLYFEAVIDEFELGDRTLTQLKSGTLKQFSIGFNYIWDKIEYDAALDAFICKELYLAEGSVVTLAANPMAVFAGMKSEEREDERIRIQNEIEVELKALGFTRSLKLRQLFSESLALAGVEPPEALKEQVRAAGQIDTPTLDWAAINNIF
jgi:HK97 family phage prohead protease